MSVLRFPVLAAALLAAGVPAEGQVRLPSIFGDHMVLQRNQVNAMWGWAGAGESVSVSLGGQRHTVTADDEGWWRVRLEPLPAGGPHRIVVRASNEIVLNDVMVGEIWICSGQSNMEWPVQLVKDADLEIRTADFPRMRLIQVPHRGTQEPQYDFEGGWQPVTARSVRDFSAVGYFFGRWLHRALDVPVGVIQTAWGASAAEAWVRRDLLEADPRYGALMARWEETERTVDPGAARAEHEKAVAKWEAEAEAARARGEEPSSPRPWFRDLINGQFRPANLFNGMLRPLIGYGIRGVIWYQGETNTGRPRQYRHLFPLLIRNWRSEWGAGDFPFYWVQLADFATSRADRHAPAQGPPPESAWAELREAQTLTLALPNTGQAVIIDLGEANDIHPRNKQDVAARLARIALARDYGFNVPYRSPLFREISTQGRKAVLYFRHAGQGLKTLDHGEVRGFAIAGRDRKFHWAEARITGRERIEVWSDAVADPVAVRYAWGDDPVCNVYGGSGLPLTPFRTDQWPGVTAGADDPH